MRSTSASEARSRISSCFRLARLLVVAEVRLHAGELARQLLDLFLGREQFVARLGEIGFQRRDLPSKGLVVLGDGGGQRLTVGAGVTARFLGSRVRGAVRPRRVGGGVGGFDLDVDGVVVAHVRSKSFGVHKRCRT